MSKTSSVTWGNGLKVEMVRLDQLKFNPWNPNKMSDEIFAKEVLSIQNNGFVDPVKVRELPDGTLEIVDGEHRVKASRQVGLVEVPVVNLGKLSDEAAKKLTIIANELRGSPEPVLLAALIKDLNATISLADLSLELPMSAVELDSLLKSTTEFDWGETEKLLADAPAREVNDASVNLGGERKFQLGVIKGNVASRLSDELVHEFNRSAAAVGSANPELVLRDWLSRLQESAADTDARAQPAAVRVPKRPKKDKEATS